ncbi:type II toxin-antitoxin system Phd/YefM family antitoxin [Aliivibrio kagoshimensis]|uniref:type II toxin-antitoxin system Phd/YefM family antitoxin n=1 Tax=Aliivibrio kagoshimensis TaxID=2910230 RepID=UPI003D108564
METIPAYKAQTQLQKILKKAEWLPVIITRKGRPASVVISIDEFDYSERVKLKVIKDNAEKGTLSQLNNSYVDGEQFFDDISRGVYDAKC